VSHSQRCLDSNRFGDGFDCICDEEPLPKALKRIAHLEKLTRETVPRFEFAALSEECKEMTEAIREAAGILAKLKAEEMIGLDDVNRWLQLAVVVAARKGGE